MIRAYTMRLKTTGCQGKALDALLSQLCELYNMALEQRRNVWRSHRKAINFFDQCKQLTELRAGVEEYRQMPQMIQRDPLKRLQRSFDAFFRRLKSGDKPGYPRFRAFDRYDSFSVDKANFSFDGSSVRIVKLGVFRTKTKCKIKGIPLELRVKRCGSKWQAQVVCDIGPAPEKILVVSAVGIDVGLTSLITLSDGTEISNPRWTRREENCLAVANRNLASKKRGSNNHKKSRECLRRVHQRIAGKRIGYLVEVAKGLFSKYDLVAHEHLKIRNMARSTFAKSIMDAAWGQLVNRLNCEAESAGKWVVAVNPRNTTKNCSGCGISVPKDISQRQHECPSCGLSLGRDHNAALNILRLGKSLALKAECAIK